MTTDKQQAKAAEYLAAGKVCVVEVSTKDGYGEFLIAGTLSEPYRVLYHAAMWSCDCPARVPVCAHILACQSITKFDAITHPPKDLFVGDDAASRFMRNLLEGS